MISRHVVKACMQLADVSMSRLLSSCQRAPGMCVIEPLQTRANPYGQFMLRSRGRIWMTGQLDATIRSLILMVEIIAQAEELPSFACDALYFE